MVDICLKIMLDEIIDDQPSINKSDLIKKLSNSTSFTKKDLPDIIYYLQDNCVDVINDIEESNIQDESYLDKQLKNENVQWYLESISQYKELSRDEEVKLFEQITLYNDKSAKDTIINSNLRFVVNLAKNYVVEGIDLIDLIQAGNMGLLYAVDKYDYAKKVKFSAQAYLAIIQSIIRFIQKNSSNINIPIYLYEQAYTFNKIISDYLEQYEHYPTKSYIVEVYNIMESAKKCPHFIDEDKYDDVLRLIINNDTLYIDSENSTYETTEELIDTEFELNIVNNELAHIIEDVIKKHIKSERTRDMVRRRFGIYPYTKAFTLDAIGKEYNIGRERVRQIIEDAMKRISQSKRALDLLGDFY